MKSHSLILICLIIFVLFLFFLIDSGQKNQSIESSQKNQSIESSQKNPSNELDKKILLERKFRRDISLYISKSKNETNPLKSEVYRNYAMSNLYFLKPFISDDEYSLISESIKNGLSKSNLQRYINPEIILTIIDSNNN